MQQLQLLIIVIIIITLLSFRITAIYIGFLSCRIAPKILLIFELLTLCLLIGSENWPFVSLFPVTVDTIKFNGIYNGLPVLSSYLIGMQACAPQGHGPPRSARRLSLSMSSIVYLNVSFSFLTIQKINHFEGIL